MIILDSLLVGGIKFVLDKVATAVEEEMNDETSLREELLAAQMRVELGEMSEEDFVELEADILARLREIRDAQRGEESGAVSLSGAGGFEVDVTYRGEEEG
ncbi:MAG TPA: gas vesicle protein GvpG [Thermoanaerobaculia bacterium]|nr:gas vesicle protein GvpG [Thermoanaerobaculia bacterium]